MGRDKKRRHEDKEEDSSAQSTSDSESSGDHKKHKKEKKHKNEKKHKKHKSKDKGKDDLVKQAKKFLKAQLAGETAGLPGGSKEVVPSTKDLPPPVIAVELRISDEDYFAKSAEFTAWLQEERHVFFNELTTERSHEFFKEFAALWNAKQLGAKYYAGQVAAPVKRTSHVWGFASSSQGGANKAKGMAAYLDDQKERQGELRAAEKEDRKKWKGNQKELLDELLPKATGREAQIEKRIARREDAKARDASPDAVRLPGGGDVYGGEDSFAAAKAWEAKRAQNFRQKQALRAEEINAKAAAFQAKEDEKMAGFRALAAKGAISIAKRE